MAVKVARENIRDSGLENVSCDVSDLLAGVDRKHGAYDVICANIVADIIIRMSPDVGNLMHEKSVLLTSGIISERADDVIAALSAHGLQVLERREENGWCALAVTKA